MGVKSNECPVSFITHESRELIQIYFRSKVLKEAGVSALSSKDLPIKVADAFVVIDGEANSVEGTINEFERYDAMHSKESNDSSSGKH